MNKLFLILVFCCAVVALKAQHLSDSVLINLKAKKVIVSDERTKGIQEDDGYSTRGLNGRLLDVVYADKIMMTYQPTSAHPYNAQACRLQFFRQEKEGVMNYQMVTLKEEDFVAAYSYWKNDTTAIIIFRDSLGNDETMLWEKKLLNPVPVANMGK